MNMAWQQPSYLPLNIIELSEASDSMFKWYQSSQIYYIYTSDVNTVPKDIRVTEFVLQKSLGHEKLDSARTARAQSSEVLRLRLAGDRTRYKLEHALLGGY